jgi:hypothetical protein
MAGTTAPFGATVPRGATICLTGTIARAEPIGIIMRGTHRLLDATGRIIAALQSNVVNLFALEGRFLTVCGIDEGVIEGVRSILVTQVFQPGAPTPAPAPPPAQLDLRTLLLFLLLTQPGLLRGIRPEILLAILFGLGQFGAPGLGALGKQAAPGLGAFGAPGTTGLTGVGGS